MTPAEIASIRPELESEQTWRQDEIRFLRNQLASFSNARQKMQFRRSLVVMLYAHYEGYCKFALERYVKAINAARLTCADATPAVVAGTWHQLFTAVESGDRKAKIFKSTLSHDERLHRFARRREFVEKLDELVKMPIDVPDGTVDTGIESLANSHAEEPVSCGARPQRVLKTRWPNTDADESKKQHCPWCGAREG